jgi:hypothetical protein
MTALLLGPAEQEALRRIRERAAGRPVDMLALPGQMESEQGRAAHRAQMTSQTVEIPVHYIVTYSVETGHPYGPCRHMSMSAPRAGRIPNPPGVLVVAEELGFVGRLERTSSLTVKGLTLQGAAISDALGGNGAGIRDQSAGATTLRVENSNFLNNQDGILTGGSGNQETIEIIGSSFIGNGSGTGQTHALYVGDALSLLVSNSLFCGTLEGHDIKSRAKSTTVQGSTVFDGATGAGCAAAGSTSYAIEAPNGGVVQILDTDIIQGAATHNTTMVRYGAEGLASVLLIFGW